MESARKILRISGRILVVLLLAFLCGSRWMNQDTIKNMYLSSYENFRQMGIMRRLFMLPLARNVK